VFNRTVDGQPLEFIAIATSGATSLLADVATGSEWDFTGHAVSGPLKGRRLDRIACLEEFWFDWKTYHPSTDLARRVF
jgi:hypothetical protein